MSDVFLCRKGTLTAASKRDLKAAGIIVVESTEPAGSKFIRATETVNGSDMLYAAMAALSANVGTDIHNVGQRHRAQFTNSLFELVKAQHDAAGAS